MSRPVFHAVPHGSPEWLQLRRSGIGASEIPIITGDAPWGDVRIVYQDKLGLAARSVASRAMEVGSRLEDAIRAWYAEDTGEKVNRVHGVYRHREIPFIIASPDSLTAKRPRRVVQIKVADSLGDEWGPEGTDEVPDHYREQIEWEMLATGVELATLVVFVVRARRLAVFEAAREPSLSDALIGYGRDFWRCVETRTLPDLPALGQRIHRLRPDDVEPDDELVALAAKHVQMKASHDAIGEELARVKDALRERLEQVGGTRGLLPDGRRFAVHYRRNRDGSAVQWELLFNEMRQRLIDAGTEPEAIDELVEDYTAVTPGDRPLRVTASKEKQNRAA